LRKLQFIWFRNCMAKGWEVACWWRGVWVQHHHSGTKKIQAHVLTKNSKSLKMFNEKGFFEVSRILELDFS